MPKAIAELDSLVTRAMVPTTTGLKIAAPTATNMKAARKPAKEWNWPSSQ